MVRAAWLLALAALAPPPAAAGQDWVRPPPKQGYVYPDCYCTNRGERVELGQLACLSVDGRSFLARCGMSLNNPTWRKVQDGCPSAKAAPLSEPGPELPEPG